MSSSRRAPGLGLIVVGKMRPPLAAAAQEYEQRVSEREPMRVDEVSIGPGGSGEAARREAAQIRRRLPPRAHVVALDVSGRAFGSSEELATWLVRRLEVAIPTVFVVGGPGGLDPQLLADADERRSLGPMTLPHQLARVVLAEQLYRALCVRDGHPYPR